MSKLYYHFHHNDLADLIQSGVTLGNDGLSLVLPSGRILGHRALRVYYAQKFRPVGNEQTSGDLTISKIARVKERLADPTQALIPVAGGAGGYGRGLEVMKARNAGEAKWAKKQAQGFHDQKARQLHKTKMGFKHNNQKRKFRTFTEPSHHADPSRLPRSTT